MMRRAARRALGSAPGARRPFVRRARAGLALAVVCAALGPAAAFSAPGAPRILSVSPVPGSGLLLPATTIAIRFDRPVEAGTLDLAAALAVAGSASGDHPGRAVLSDDRRTLVFRPDHPFAPGERVQATLGFAAPRRPGLLESGAFEFTIAKEPPPRVPSSLALELAGASPPPLYASLDPGPGRAQPLGFPDISTVILGPPAPGSLFLSNVGFFEPSTPHLLIVDNAGQTLFFRPMDGLCFDFKLQPTGLLTYYNFTHGAFYALDSTYAVVDSFRCGNDYPTDLHELRLLPDGHALLMSYDPHTVDMSQIVVGGDTAAAVIGLVIQELDSDRNVVFQWRSWDHFVITDALHENLTAPVVDYVHGNAIDLDTDGNLLISSRHLDEITKIDRQTGDMIWRWGGKNNQFTFLDDTLGFSHQHAIRRLKNGHLLLYDNGNFHVPPFSRAVEYAMDENAHTVRLEWKYRNDPDTYGFAMGYCQRLENGNTLISWGAGKPDLTEVAADGTKIMDLHLPDGVFTYRGFRSEWLHAWTGVPAPRPRPRPSLSLAVSPNPARRRFQLTAELPVAGEVSLAIYDLQGRLVRPVLSRARYEAGPLRIPLDLSDTPAGLYWCRISEGEAHEARKVLILP